MRLVPPFFKKVELFLHNQSEIKLDLIGPTLSTQNVYFNIHIA